MTSHEGGFEAWFKTGDNSLVDIALALFLTGRFNVEIDEFLTVDNSDTQFLRLCRIK
jgi:hypothetical protein